MGTSWRTSVFQRFADVYPTTVLGRSRVARGLWRAALEIIRPERVRLRLPDYRIEIDCRPRFYGRALLHRGGLEVAATAAFRALAGPDSTVVDIGANVGHYALTAASRVGPQGNVYAFEPDPGAAARLRRNVELNGFGNVVVHQVAVGDTDGRAQLHLDARNAGGHSLYPQNVFDNGQCRAVETVRLDSVFADTPVDLIKIDAQGAEHRVLDGGSELLRRAGPALLLEYWPFGIRNGDSSPTGLLEHLRDLQYVPAAVFSGRQTIVDDLQSRLKRLAGRDADPHAAADVLLVARKNLLETNGTC